MNTIDSFTGDIIAFLNCGGRADEFRSLLRKRDNGEQPADEFIQEAVIAVLSPIMVETPALVQQLVGRALVRHVDWRAIAQWATVNPEAN
jgi:hypothetical protein